MSFNLSEENLFSIIKSKTGILFWVVSFRDGEYYYDMVNENFADVENQPPSHYEGKKVKDLHDPGQYTAIEKSLQKAKALGGNEYEIMFVKDGKQRHFHIKIMFFATENEDNYIAIGNEITEFKEIQKRLEKEEIKIKEILNSLNNPVLATDDDYNLIYFNKAYCKLIGRKEEELEKKNLYQLFPDFKKSKAFASYINSIEKGTAVSGEEEFGDKHLSYTVRRTKEGNLVVAEDVTMKKKAENDLKRERDAYHALVESSSNSTNVIDLCSLFLEKFVTILDLDRGSVRLVDEKKEKLDLVSTFGFCPDEEIDQKKPRLLAEKSHITTYVAETKIPVFAPDLERHFLYGMFSESIVKKGMKSLFSWPLTNDFGAVFGVMHLIGKEKKRFEEKDKIFFENTAGLFSEILEKKISQEKLSESEKNIRTLQENIQIGLFRTDIEGNIVSANHAFVKMFGYRDFSEIEKINALDLYALPADRANLIDLHGKNDSVMDFEIPMKKKGGEIIWCLAKEKHIKSEDGRILYIDGSIEDITFKKDAQKALEESRERYRLLFESADDAIFMMKDHLFIDCNQKACEMFRLPKDVLVGKKPFETSPEFQTDGTRSREKAIAYMEKAMSGFPQRFDWIHKRGDESVFDAEVSLNRFTSGNNIYLQAIVRDFTEMNKYINALKNSEEKFRHFMELAPDILFRLNLKENKFELLSPSIENVLGYPLSEAFEDPKKFLFSMIREEDKEEVIKAISEVYDPKNEKDFMEIRFKAVKSDGSVLCFRATVRFERKGEEILRANGILSDQTHQMKMEEELMKIEKLESVGILAGGIAHDFNNILTGVLGNISLSRVYLDQNSEAWKLLEEAETAAIRAKNLTRQLLTFSKGGQPIKKAMNLAEILTDTGIFATRGSSCRCEFELSEEVFPVDIDEGQIVQVLNNIIINAIQAMPKGGVIKISASNLHIDEDLALPVSIGNYVIISLADSGPGIEEDDLSRIFDPFFTTKDSGSGLGLTTAYSIVKNHGGFIEALSKRGEGTTFRIYLPASRNKPVREENQSRPEKGKGRILVMDDEELVVNVLSDMLCYLGYEVDSAPNGNAALKKYADALLAGRRYGAVIMDLTIQGGGMGGRDAVGEILKIDPNAVVYVSSGYSDDPVISNYKKYGFSGFLIKPYSLIELSKLLKSK
ncbi:PAS domain S-box protein [candidate division WOR-3 bacterium]|nr:PAS domain S-box protein [candidate division WOR-3 bacterium]